MPKLALFDLDGTLVRAGGCGRLALNAAVKKLYGRDNVCAGISLEGCTDKQNFSSAYTVARGRKASARDIALISKTYLSLLPAEVEKAAREKRYFKLPGIDRFLAELKKRGVMVALGTGNLKGGAYLKLGPSGLAGHFECGGFGCDGFTRLEMLKAAVRRAEKLAGTKIAPAQIYVIGDTPKDVSAGKEGGYHTAAVTDGFAPREALLNAAPELLEKDFSDMRPWLVWLGLERDPKGVKRASYIFPDCGIEHVQFGRTGMDTEQLRLMKKKRNAKLAKKVF
ncbi:MAG: HAD family hydrolase [Elusimicrobiales bacterium]